LYDKVKVFINGAWLGISEQPYELFLSLKEKKYKGIINIYTSIVFNYSLKEIRVCNDGGRVSRPVLRVKDKNILITRNILEQLKEGELIWDNLLTSSVLDNSVIELHEEDLMICDGESNGMCIAGVYGGAKSGVKNETTAIFLESAYFDPKSIRRTSTRHGLRTDAATHFEKGIDPAVTETALLRAVQLILELASGEVASDVYKIEFKTFEPFNVSLEYKNIKRLTGADISKEDTKKILDLLEMKIASESETTLGLLVPPYRTDVTREADVIEDILRIYGFNNVVIPTKLNASVNFSKSFDADKLYNNTADTLVNFGFYEMMNNSITKSKYQSLLKNQRIHHSLYVFHSQ
jgi:phenylalanyl-tRNA synthetase beta chain